MRITSRCGRAAAAQCSVLAFGQNGNYLFELAAQPGGPVGRPLTTAGSKPIPIPGRPQGVRPCSPGLVAVHSHLVPSPVALSRSQLLPLVQFRENQTRAETPRSLFNHARYDALSRQVSATNPESGTVSYVYDAAGNVATRTDARGITTTYSYDALNRPTQTSYSDGTAAITYRYDGSTVAYGVGQLAAVANGSSTTNYLAYDARGNVATSNQQTQGQVYSFAYGYNLADQIVSETYPSGRVATTSYDAAGRPLSLGGTLAGGETVCDGGGLCAAWRPGDDRLRQ